MKKITLLLLIWFFAPYRLSAQTQEVTQLILNLEKLRQLRKTLQELKKGYDILFAGYNKIRDIAQGNFKLHQAFLEGLLQISPAVKNYGRIKDIAALQLAILGEYRQASRHLFSSAQLTTDELTYLEKVYGQLLAESIKNLNVLTDVLTARKLRASDQERLSIIDAIYQDMTEKLAFLRSFNSENGLLLAQRSQEHLQLRTVRALHQIGPP
nr:TerB family tellurite resistance protein [uncultured Dyadobacter sp.]